MNTNLQTVRHALPSTPETVFWGFLSPDVPPVLHIASGDIVDINTVNPVGVPLDQPRAFFDGNGLAFEDAACDMVSIMQTVHKDEGPHILTGPVHVAGAAPGDVLEVRVLAVQPRAPYYGVSFSMPGAGSLPDLISEPWAKVIPLDMAQGVGKFVPGIDIPLAPFMGTMGVAPTEKVSSIPPGRFGGNIDLKDLTPGSRLYLPVLVDGALFYTGDGHAAQGNGEVSLTGLETSLSGSFQFVLHKRCARVWPSAETAEHYIVMGLDPDLNEAARLAVEQAVQVIAAHTGLSPVEAYSLSSLLVDFEVTQIVDGVKGIHGKIPKRQFTSVQQEWWGPDWPAGAAV